MLRGLSALQVVMWNAIIIGVWHIALFILCVKMPASYFDGSKPRYAPRKWERNGRIYRDVFKINLWKDRLPQHVGRDGFSKERLDSKLSVEYVDQFILETCRSEWEHTANCAIAVVTLFINPIPLGFLFSFLVLLGNVPFAFIQRYNRFRLQILRRRLLREKRALEGKSSDVSTVAVL